MRLKGFVVRGDKPDRFRLARFLITCCAADAVPVFVDVKPPAGEIPEDNDWLDVTGRLVRRQGWFLVKADSMTAIPTPEKPT